MKSTESRVRDHLAASTSTIRPAGDLDRVMREGVRRRTMSTVVAATATAAALAVVVAVATLTTPGTAPVQPLDHDVPMATAAPATTPVTTANVTGCGAASPGDQPLPSEVAATRQTVLDLAFACDYDGLAAFARESGTVLSFGGDVADPAAMWAEEAAASGDPVPLFARMLATTPHHDADAGVWSWPAVHGDPTEQSWAELEALVGAEKVAALRTDGAGYTGWRVGIDDTGRWLFAVAGD